MKITSKISFDTCTHINNFIVDLSNGIDTVIDRNFGELANSLTIAMRGKSKFIDCLYLARNTHSAIDHPEKLEWVTGENWHLSYIQLIKSLSSLLSYQDKLSQEESNSKAKMAVNTVLSPTFHPRRSSVIKLIRNFFIRYFDKTGMNVLSRFYRRVKYTSISTWLFLIAKTSFSRSSYYNDASFIINSCKKK